MLGSSLVIFGRSEAIGTRNARRHVYLKIIRLACDDNYNINHDQLACNVFIMTVRLTFARHLYDEKLRKNYRVMLRESGYINRY